MQTLVESSLLSSIEYWSDRYGVDGSNTPHPDTQEDEAASAGRIAGAVGQGTPPAPGGLMVLRSHERVSLLFGRCDESELTLAEPLLVQDPGPKRREAGPRRSNASATKTGSVGGWGTERAHERERLDVLAHPLLEQLDLLDPQVANEIAPLVANDEVHEDNLLIGRFRAF